MRTGPHQLRPNGLPTETHPTCYRETPFRGPHEPIAIGRTVLVYTANFLTTTYEIKLY